MIGTMADLTIKEAQDMLDHWAGIMRSRDRCIIAAAGAGLPKMSIARRMGISHNTVYEVLRKHREQAEARNGNPG